MTKLSIADDVALLRYILGYKKTWDLMPTVREIKAEFGLASTSPAQGRLDRLIEMGAIERLPNKARALRITPKARQVIKDHEAEIARVVNEAQKQ